MDGLTGQVLYQQNGAETNFPASTTKLLTALVAVEHGKLDQQIRVSQSAIDKGFDSASCYISEGEVDPLEYLLYGLLLPSGNDCADAIAEGLTQGNKQQFVDWMNETAQRLGATSSHFANPHGLHDDQHYTTAHDLALIARAALSNPVVRKISSTREFNWPGKNNGTYYNQNALVWTRDDLIGGKTGYTEHALHTLAEVAERNGRQLIGVTMGYEDKNQQYNDMDALLDYGFENFVQVDAVAAGAPQGEIQVSGGMAPTVPVMAASAFAVSAAKEGEQQVRVVPKLASGVSAPVVAGQNLGLLEIRDGDQVLGTVPLVAKAAVEAKPALTQVGLQWALLVAKWLAGAVFGLLVFRTLVKTVRRSLRRRRRGRSEIGRVRATGTYGYRPPR